MTAQPATWFAVADARDYLLKAQGALTAAATLLGTADGTEGADVPVAEIAETVAAQGRALDAWLKDNR